MQLHSVSQEECPKQAVTLGIALDIDATLSLHRLLLELVTERGHHAWLSVARRYII